MSKLVSQLRLFKDMTQLIWTPLLKNCKICHEIDALISEVEKIASLLWLLPATNTESERIFSALKHVKTYLKSTMENNRLQALMLMHVHKNILDNINLAYVANEFVDRRDSRKQTFGHFSQNDS